jgi:K+/H+ antiporter YhaU regulatory subunit KhtT
LVGQTVDRVCGSAIALLIRRAGGELLPNPSRDTVVNAGDLVVTFGEPDMPRAVT